MWIGAQAWIDTEKTGGRNPLVEQAAQLSIIPDEETVRQQRELDEIRGEKVADDWRDDPRVAPQAADSKKGVEASNPPGSFEAFASMFGRSVTPPAPDGAS